MNLLLGYLRIFGNREHLQVELSLRRCSARKADPHLDFESFDLEQWKQTLRLALQLSLKELFLDVPHDVARLDLGFGGGQS